MPSGMLGFDISIVDPRHRIQLCIKEYDDDKYQGFEKIVMKNLRIVSARHASPSRESIEAEAVFETKVTPELCNPMDIMHGGATATLVDMTTSMALGPVAQANFWEKSGVTRTLQLTYLRPIKQGSTIVLYCTLRSISKTLAATYCVIYEKGNRRPLVTAEHGKAAMKPQLGRADFSSMI